MIKFYCEVCGKSQDVILEDMTKDVLNKKFPWGDILCKECKFVIATMIVTGKLTNLHSLHRISPHGNFL